ncbi:MAG: glycosyltransferase [Balneolales bacterium]
MIRKKALIITYYWPPSGGPGVQRWLKFTKYLRDFGWEPVIYTAENPEVPEIDHSLVKDIPENVTVIKRKIWEPYQLYKFFVGQKQDSRISQAFLSESKKPKTAEMISRWIRGNFFIPDARKYWIKPSIRFLTEWLKDNPVDVIISTGPPHSMHLIAHGLKIQSGIPWIADFRDPWTNIEYYDDLLLTSRSDRKHHQLEAKIIKNANRVIAVSPTWKAEFEKDHKRPIDLLTNGYDEEDFEGVNPGQDPYFSISHIGTMIPSRNPGSLWSALSQLVKENEDFAHDFRLILVGRVDHSVMDAIKAFDLQNNLITTGYLSHNEVMIRQKSTWVLLDILKRASNTKGLYAGKLFEYLAAKRPILLIGPSDSDAAKLIEELQAGYAVDFEDQERMKTIIKNLYNDYQKNNLEDRSNKIEQFSRKNLTRKLSSILNEVISTSI